MYKLLGSDSQLQNKPARWRSHLWPFLSLLLLFLNTLFFMVRPDAAALWTLLPVWLYSGPGLLLATLSGHAGHKGRRVHITLCCLWLISTATLADETPGLWRGIASVFRHSSGQLQKPNLLRVVSLNCSVGLPEAAAEVMGKQPDLVLLQEAPSREEVRKLARKLWGSDGGFVWGVDGAVLARGVVEPIPLPDSLSVFATAARVTTRNSTFVTVSFRLTTRPFRFEAWSPDAWRAQSSHRRAQRVQTQALVKFLQTLPKNTPVIIGGDCNAPGGDPALQPFKPLLRDAYYEGGLGWCNTFQNGFSVLRIDQIWLSNHWQVKHLSAQKTQNSDHLMVVCEVASG